MSYKTGRMQMNAVVSPAKKVLKKLVKEPILGALNSYVSAICRAEFENQEFFRFNERPSEFAFVFKKLAQLYPKTILDVGTGTTALPHLMRNCGHLVTATDNVKDYWPQGMVNRHYWIVDDDITQTKLVEQFDMVTCVSTLEHIKKFDAAVRNMLRLTKPGGHVIITCPYNEPKYCANCYDLPESAYGQDAPYVTQSYSRKELDGWCRDNGATVVDQEFWQYWTGELWTQGQQIIPPQKTSANEPHQLTCLLLKKL
jgi:2-polyprenyl-3-methyl-5-hydroxy-6-metoxy-1,4-benzoquinol methylase